MRKKQGDPYQGTVLVIANITDPAKFQTLCDRLLEAQYHFEVHPRGISEHGTVKGQPDSWGWDSNGKVCAFQYGICTRTSWPGKLKSDLEEVNALETFSPELFVFCTNCSIDPDKEREWQTKVKDQYGWELRMLGVLELAHALDTSQQGIRKDMLGIEVEHHGWESLLAACSEQRQRQYSRYRGKYNPSLYVQRQAEQKIQTWYRQMVVSLHQGEPPRAERLAIVDQAGTGKTNIVFHLAEEFGSKAPVIIIPGNVIITDQHTLEREIVEAVGYPVNDRTYHADIHELCQLTQRRGFPFLVILDGADENSDPTNLRKAIEYLWSVCQNYPFLLLVTCRDAFWPLMQSPLWKDLTENSSYGRHVIPLREYNDDEFNKAVRGYFSKYNVHVQLSYEAGRSLRSPLLLSIFAEGNRNSSFKLISSVADKDLWRRYWEIKIEAVYEAVERNIPQQVIQEVIANIALLMVNENRSTLSLDKLVIAHSLLNRHDSSSRSLFLQLKNAAVLFEDASGRVKFVYETFLEFIVGMDLSRSFEEAQEHEDILLRIEELASSYRWRQVPLYIAENVSHPAAIIERLCVKNPWLAAEAIKRLQSLVPLDIQTRVITRLEENLSSRFTLDRQRAARFLGLLRATGSKDALLRCWFSEKSEAALRSLATLGAEEVLEPFIYYLGKRSEWYLLEKQELIDILPQGFRHCLIQTALALLSNPEHASDAAHTLGYLKYEQATDALFSYLVGTEYCDWAALGALLHIQTEVSFERVEIALSEIGKRLDLKDRQGVTGRLPANPEEDTPTRNELYWALDYMRVYGTQQCLREKIIPFLTKLLSHQNEYVRHMAVRSLGQLGAAETMLAIIQSKQSETKKPTMGITETLYELGTQIDVKPLIAVANDPSTPEHVLYHVIRALGLSHDKRAIETLRLFLKKPPFLANTVIALGDAALPEAAPLLVQLLEPKKVNLRNSDVKDRDMLDHMIVGSLGKLQYPDTFPALERFAQRKLPVVWIETTDALAACGGEKAIPFLHQIWELDVENQRYIIQALLWIGTNAAADEIKELLAPYTLEKAVLLAKAMGHGRSLPLSGWSRSSATYDWVDDQLIDILNNYIDEMSKEDKLTVIFALEYIALPSALRLLERIASDPHYDIQRSSNSPQTLRDVAVWGLCEIGSEKAIDLLFDKLADHNLGFLEFLLAKQEQEWVKDALQRHLGSANDATLGKLLELLGLFGDHTVLPKLATYIDDPRIEIADTAYTAEQQILGMA